MVARIVESPDHLALPLPPGLTVVPAQDPDEFARVLAAQTGGTLVSSSDEVAAVLARRRLSSVADVDGSAAEVAYLQSLLEGGSADLPSNLVRPGERTAVLRSLGTRLAAARDEAKAARVALLKREAAVQAEVRKTSGVLLDVEPELARRVAHRVSVALRKARAAQRALGPKPGLDKETEQAARRAMSRLEDARFAAAKSSARVHSRLAVGNVIGLLLAFVGVMLVWGGAQIDAGSVYAVLALAGLSPLAALAIGAAGAMHARRRVQAATAECAAALQKAGVADVEALAERRRELEAWLDRADATATARDAWKDALVAWETMAAPGADPKTVEELLEAGARVRAAREDATAARATADEAMKALAVVEDEVRARLARPSADVDGAPIVVTGSRRDKLALEELAPSVPVALVTGIDAEAAREPETAYAGEAEHEVEVDERPTQAHSFLFDAEAARRLRRRVRRRS
ncbi:MAG TPA: hypothetical protein VM938_04505 [Acidimicrobiales bacterium]|nr:hypothetical protein [Acidimicrobiales bacterium]